MFLLPKYAAAIMIAFAPAFTKPSFGRFVLLFVAAVLCRGRRTVTRMVDVLSGAADGDVSDYHRLLSRAPWKYNTMYHALASLVLEVVPDEWTELVVDDTGTRHPGKTVFGKACHRDAVKSSKTKTAYYYGHKWVVLCVLVKFPWIKRRLALPIFSLLYIPEKAVKKHNEENDTNIRFRTMPQLAKIMLQFVTTWFPDRKFRFLGDGGYSSHDLARFCSIRGTRLALVGKFHPQANLYGPPIGKRKNARKGDRLLKPEEQVKLGNFRHVEVKWYNSSSRKVRIKSGTGLWYKGGQGVVEVRWVFVQDEEGTHRDEYFFTTDMSLSPVEIVESYTGRWNIETTFQECKEHLGLSTTRNRTENSVRRSVPCLLGVYSLLTLMFHEFWKEHRKDWRERMDLELGYDGYEKENVTFSDVLTFMRREFWTNILYHTLPKRQVSRFLDSDTGKVLLNRLAQPA